MATLKGVTEKLVKKGKEGRKKRNNQNAEEVWELMMEDLLVMVEQREQYDVKKAEEKARKAALRGKVGFAKLVWKKLCVAYDLFK